MLAEIVFGGVIKLEAVFVEPITGASMNPARSVSRAVMSVLLSGIWIYLMATILEAAYKAFITFFPKARSAARRNPRVTPNIPSENLYTAVRTG